jgi:peptidoglycan/LPS O-acetylase OafA/YrhL
MVLLAHAIETMHSTITKNEVIQLLADGKLGVQIFFVISGYLITKLLLIEKEKTGRISLKYFYLRRIFRIFPVFYLYIILVVLLKIFLIPILFENYTMVGLAAVYLWNYSVFFNIHLSSTDNVSWFFGHFWSLAMEEQFYLIWPIALVKLNNYDLKKLVLAIILVMPFIRVVTYFFLPNSRGQMEMMIQTGGGTIFMGCLGALIEDTNYFKEKVLKIIYNNGIICFVMIFLFIISPMIYQYFGGVYKVPVGNTLDNLAILLLVLWSVYVPTPISNFLNSKILVQIGVLSYSLYIWQQLFLTTKLNFWVNQFPQNLFVVFLIGFISYYLIEKPILRLKNKLVRI